MTLLLFVIGTEWIVVLVVAAILLLFGGTKLPQLAKALGQSKKAFREGLDEGERRVHRRPGELELGGGGDHLERRILEKSAPSESLRDL